MIALLAAGSRDPPVALRNTANGTERTSAPSVPPASTAASGGSATRRPSTSAFAANGHNPDGSPQLAVTLLQPLSSPASHAVVAAMGNQATTARMMPP